jgi:hypothetical protein
VGLLNPHLDDAAFADIWADRLTTGEERPGDSAEAHLRTCAECRTRHAAFGEWLETMRADAFAEADQAFNAERLATQQAQIARRIEGLDNPAKVLTFPRFARAIAVPAGGRQRWVAAAAAAGLIVGVGVGQLFEFGTAGPIRQAESLNPAQQLARGTMPVGERAGMAVVPAVAQSDELFLYEADGVPSQVRVPESLQYLNAITPGARDYDPR